MGEKLICGLLQGQAENEEKAKKIAQRYKDCPYIDFMSTSGSLLYATFFLPEKQKWWIEDIEKTPKQTFGLEKASVTFMDTTYYPYELKMRLPAIPVKMAPCGANCETCDAFEKCLGCPATTLCKVKFT